MINAFILHLLANTTNFLTISHAWTLEPVDTVTDKLPILWVFEGDEDFGEDGTDGLVAKMVTAKIHVYIICEIADLAARKSELRDAAIGWSAGVNYTELTPVSSRTIGLKGSVVWREEIYANRVKITEL